MSQKFTNSPLVTYTKMSPFKNSPRNQPITKITIHHMAGVASVESFGTIVTTPGREMSANYAIGNDGRIGLYCDEKDRSWCSSSGWNDHRAITIEVSNSKLGEPWPISQKAWDSMIALCVDICKRNNIPKLTYTGDKNGSLTFHRFFAPTGCVPVESTDVLTPTGWVPMREIKIGDVIATVSPKDFSIKFDTVENMVPVRSDTVFVNDGMAVTKDHRVLYFDAESNQIGYKINEYQKICDREFTVPLAGTYHTNGINMSSSEMIFLLEMQRVGTYSTENHSLEFSYIMESKVQYFKGLLDNLGYQYEKTIDDLGPVRFSVTDERAWDLCATYLSGSDFNWKWSDMNPTQFSYFIHQITSHCGTSWMRQYTSKSVININIVQALCALNERGSYVDGDTLYIEGTLKSIKPGKSTTTIDDVDVACVTVKTGCFLMRQNGRTFITGNCPGEYIFSRAQEICDLVNAQLGGVTPTPDPKPEPVVTDIKVGDLVKIRAGASYYGGKSIPSWVIAQSWYVASIDGDRAVIDKNEAGTASIESPVNVKDLEKATASTSTTFQSYTKYLEYGTPIYMIAGDKLYQKGSINPASRYTIVDEKQVGSVTCGLLKSGAGWIVLKTSTTMNVGDRVTVTNAVTYDGKPFKVYEPSYVILRMNGDRVVISSDGKNVTAAVNIKNLKKK